MARRAAAREARNRPSLAPRRLSFAVALEVPADEAVGSSRVAGCRRAHSTHGHGESTLLCRAYSRRAPQAWDSRRETHDPTAHASKPSAVAAARAELAHVLAQPHRVSVRLFAGARRLVSANLRVLHR